MRAQKVEDPSMEDILSSIRKIISEDSNEDINSDSGEIPQDINLDLRQNTPIDAVQQSPVRQQPVQQTRPPVQQARPEAPRSQRPEVQPHPIGSQHNTQANSAGHLHTPTQPVPGQQQTPPQRENSNTQSNHSPQPPVLTERREYLDMDSGTPPPRQISRPSPSQQSPTQAPPVFAEKPNPLLRPAVQTPPQAENRPRENPAGIRPQENPASNRTPAVPPSLHQSNQDQGRAIPGFVETKPPTVNDPARTGNLVTETETPLHPAIANAKSFVSIQGESKNNNTEPKTEKVETPVFASPQAPVGLPMEKLISPDNVERREPDERRSHPLRRGVDRIEDEAMNELMSTKTTDSVHSAFEQLKNLTTENLDGNVREIIRPMLREWLDNNLPSMVERLVRDEIERVSRGE